MPQIQITINGEACNFESVLGAGLPLSALLKMLQLENAAVAVAVNDAILPPSLREGAVLRGGERVEIVRAVAGG